jgi:RES domain
MKLVDSLAEQEELESILEASKPAAPAAARQHYLLSTPFRYPSPHPSRFRPAGALGVWYGAESVETACTELAYWRWRFLMDSEGLRTSELIAEFSLFRAKVNGKAIDLSVEPWDTYRSDWTSDDYSACLTVAAEARRREVQWIRYWSARDVAGHCGAVMDPSSLKSIELNKQQTWVCKVSATAALMRHQQDSIALTFRTK